MIDIDDEIEKIALKINCDKEKLEDMTIGEIQKMLELKRENEIEQLKLEAMMLYSHAVLIKHAIASCFDRKNDFPDFYHAFPFLFEKEIEEEDNKEEWQIMKEKMMKTANIVNKRFK